MHPVQYTNDFHWFLTGHLHPIWGSLRRRVQEAEDTVRVSFEGEDAVGILYAADSGLMLVESKGTPTYPLNIPQTPNQ